jgi:RND family efflux transporter MFP subunit
MRRVSAGTGFLIVIAGLAACPASDDEGNSVSARAVGVAPVSKGDAVKHVTVVGTLQGEQEVQVVAQIPERIVSLRVTEGQRVRKGKVLAVLAADLQSAALKQAEAGLTSAEANRDTLSEEVERVRKLVAANAAPAAQLQGLEAQLRATEAVVAQTATGLSTATAQRRRAIITAPISGRVANLAVRKGDTATPGMPMMTLVRGKKVKATFQVPEREFLKIREEMPVRLIPLGDRTIEVDASVTLTGPVVDRRTRTGLVEVELDNEDGRLIPGAAVRAKIELERRPGVVLVPAAAILLTATTDLDGKAIAFVADGAVARRRDVVVGERQGGMMEVRSGLQVGEQLVVRGQHLLRDNSAIQVAVEGAPPAPSPSPAAPPPAEGDGA